MKLASFAVFYFCCWSVHQNVIYELFVSSYGSPRVGSQFNNKLNTEYVFWSKRVIQRENVPELVVASLEPRIIAGIDGYFRGPEGGQPPGTFRVTVYVCTNEHDPLFGLALSEEYNTYQARSEKALCDIASA